MSALHWTYATPNGVETWTAGGWTVVLDGHEPPVLLRHERGPFGRYSCVTDAMAQAERADTAAERKRQMDNRAPLTAASTTERG